MCNVDAEYAIRLLDETDVAHVVALEKAAFSSGWGAESYRRWLLAGVEHPLSQQPWLPSNAIFGAKDRNGTLLGYISTTFCNSVAELEVVNIAVQREQRKKGIGGCLLRHALQAGAAAGITRAVLEVRESNAPAIALYTAAGFQKAGIRKKYYADTGEDALVLIREHLPAGTAGDDMITAHV